ncbi:MAG: nucleotidyltransferase [Anaerolineales bacterium]|nr:nucleotidyltransferase [Anaerolineales bacterium]
MHTLGTHFELLLRNIRPPEDRLEAAKTLPPKVRNFLKDSEDFPTVEPHSRLVGSYAQDLAVGDVKDVDLLVRVAGNPEANEPEAKKLIASLKDAVDSLPEALGFDGWAGVDIEGARRSVHVYIKGRDFHLDIVPAIAPDGFESELYVPDKGFNKWIVSHPIGYIKLLTELNEKNGRKVRPLAKLLKHFRNHHMKQRRPKSYWLGALVVHHVGQTLDTTQPLAVIFCELLDGIYKQYASLLGRTDGATPNIPDPMLGHNISWNWSRTHFETFMARVDEGRKWATKALEAEEPADAVTYWQRVFGEEFFPSEVTDEASRVAAGITPGQSKVTQSGLVVPSISSVRTATPTRPTTFHGEELV